MTVLDPPFDVEAAARHLGCSPSHVRKLCREGRLRHYRLGGKLIRIPVAAIAELEGCAEATTTPAGEREDRPAEPRSALRLVKHPARTGAAP